LYERIREEEKGKEKEKKPGRIAPENQNDGSGPLSCERREKRKTDRWRVSSFLLFSFPIAPTGYNREEVKKEKKEEGEFV